MSEMRRILLKSKEEKLINARAMNISPRRDDPINLAPRLGFVLALGRKGTTILRPQGIGRNSARGAGRWEIGARLSWGKDFGPEQSQGGGPQIRMVKVGGDGAAPPSISMSSSNRQFHLEFYAQAFNLLNHTNLVGFSGMQTSSFFGQPTSALSPRRMEVGTRFNF